MKQMMKRTPRQITPRRTATVPTAGPPQGTADDINEGSLEVRRVDQDLGLRAPDIADDRNADTALDPDTRAAARSAVMLLGEPVTAPVQKATGLDPAAMQEDLDRQKQCYKAYAVCRDLRQGARAGRLIVNGARALGRRVVRQRVEFLLSPEGGLAPERRKALDKSWQAVREIENRPQAKAQQSKAQKSALSGQTQTTVADYAAQEHMLEVMGALAQGQQVNWDDLLNAAETYEELVPDTAPGAADGGTAPVPAKPPKPAKPGKGTKPGKGATPPPKTTVGPGLQGAATDRRGGGRRG